MFKSVIVANRGEIACRVFRTAKRMGLRTIAVHSDADAQAPHVAMADAAVRLGPAPARDSYLDADKVLAAARETGAEAIHPGYGFLSENADFAEAVMAAGLVWIGPPPAAIRAMGLKDAAKQLMIEAGVPVTPGYQGQDQSVETLTAEAHRIGFPVLIKAVAGGGGKGMKRVDRAEDFAEALASAQREGQSSFGDPRVLIETYITRPRHIEVQVFGDQTGQVVHLFERDCSLQRRHQKVIEEAPAPGMDAATRAAVTEAAVRAAKAVNYVGAGTVEFIADASDGLKADRIWFMEMNTRLQVEHPVTEMVTGQDLVEWQFRVASGELLPLAQDQITLTGWAMEARLYAEDPAKGFLPSIGRLEHFVLPGDVRVDTGVERGGEVSQFYDPMIAKLIVQADTREAAAAQLAEACGEVEVWPVKTNAGFLRRCLEHPRFVAGDVDTGLIAAEGEALTNRAISDAALQSAASVLRRDLGPRPDTPSPWSADEGAFGFRVNAGSQSRQVLYVDDARMEVGIDEPRLPRHGHFEPERGVTICFDRGEPYRVSAVSPRAGAAGAASNGALRAPMPGKIVAAPLKAGQAVTKGQTVVVLEAMKMEHALTAPFDGTVESLNVAVGDQVSDGAVLAVVKSA